MAAANEIDLLQIRENTFLRDLLYEEEMPSTNSVANELATKNCETPLLVIAERQTAGRGRSSNTWWSGEGSLTFTLLLDLPVRDVADIGPFSLTVGLAMCQALERFAPGADFALKWPNDVYLNEKKVCGILIERPIASEPRLSIGVGLNVNNSLSTGPDELRSKATSLLDELGAEQSLTSILIQFLRRIEELSREHLHARDHLMDQWRAYCMLTGRALTIEQQQSEMIVGLCRGVDGDGALLLQTDDGEVRCISGTVREIGDRV